MREKISVLANDIYAVERVFDSLATRASGHHAPRARFVLFYRDELRGYLLAELRKALRPMTVRELAVKLCEVEARTGRNRRLITDMVRRVGCMLWKMWATPVIEGKMTQAGRLEELLLFASNKC